MFASGLIRISFIAAVLVTAGCDSNVPVAENDTELDMYGQPNLNGIWQALGSAHWNLEAHAASAGPIVELGALGGIPAGQSVVVGGEIPYQPWAREKQQQHLANWLEHDPAIKCFMAGVPRSTYMPYPFQIAQGSETILITYEFAGATRIVYLNRPDFEHPFEAWMGHSRGRWEGETLVIDVTSHIPDTWFDSSGNFHSEELRVEERFRKVSENVLNYEATITDPKVFTRPWSIRMPLYRRLEENAQLLEYKCVEFAEELMYGHLVKKPDSEAAAKPEK
ncbi:MAG: hypothetical protein QF921_13110 [Pseudomonadales bacterium]|nr:hypothetical protein [Pseudomonadales bacterium]MDP6469784.1 hypothetical protein [Pseudomonadales bacterium]MDP6827613.1 hypothetical protein [Pseudomonadales bacterium]MDP6972428.1 hypothetical protein [Pseudomonadales bacterium]